jgi:regulator of replication initiation timing
MPTKQMKRKASYRAENDYLRAKLNEVEEHLKATNETKHRLEMENLTLTAQVERLQKGKTVVAKPAAEKITPEKPAEPEKPKDAVQAGYVRGEGFKMPRGAKVKSKDFKKDRFAAKE